MAQDHGCKDGVLNSKLLQNYYVNYQVHVRFFLYHSSVNAHLICVFSASNIRDYYFAFYTIRWFLLLQQIRIFDYDLLMDMPHQLNATNCNQNFV